MTCRKQLTCAAIGLNLHAPRLSKTTACALVFWQRRESAAVTTEWSLNGSKLPLTFLWRGRITSGRMKTEQWFMSRSSHLTTERRLSDLLTVTPFARSIQI